jgi:predicted MFS family arabinose efflux permease
MNQVEWRTVLSLSGIYMLRMLGMFMILPVFALYATELEGVTPALTGLAIGIYGVTQAVLQIPAGLLSDRVGRKPVIIGGLMLFAAGSVIAAMADSIYMVIFGRAIQGAGAIAAVIMALVADLTREEHRIKAMALIGMSIGVSFALALILGPVLARWIGVPGIFGVTAVLALLGILVVAFVVPRPAGTHVHRESEAVPAQFGRVLRQPELLRLDLGILLLHCILTATFVVTPLVLRDEAGLASGAHWKVYLLVLVASVMTMVPFIIQAERKGHVKPVFLGAIVMLALVQAGLYLVPVTLVSVVVLLWLFFSAFNLLESMLPSLVSRVAPADCRGTAMGFYSSAQFFGAFLGGSIGGWLHGQLGLHSIFICSAAAAVLWLLLASGMTAPAKTGSVLYRIEWSTPDELEQRVVQLRALAGVAEVVVVAEEGMAYLKVDRRVFKEASLP